MTINVYLEKKAVPLEIDLISKAIPNAIDITLTAVKHIIRDRNIYLLDNNGFYILDSQDDKIETVF